MYILENYFQSILGRARICSPAMYYPVKGLLGYTDANAAAVPIYVLFRFLHFDMYDAYQACSLVFDLLSWFFCYLLFRKGLGLLAFPASVGAAFFCFNNIRYNQTNHFDLQLQFLLPLILLGFALIYRSKDQYGKRKVWAALSGSGLLLGLQFATSFYLAWFFCLWFLIFILILLAQGSFRKALVEAIKTHRWGFLGAASLFFISLLPVLVLYLPVLKLMGPRPVSQAIDAAPKLKALFWMGSQNWAWGWLTRYSSISSMPFEWENRLGLGMAFSLFWIGTGIFLASRNFKVSSSERRPEFLGSLLNRIESLEFSVYLSVCVSIALVVKILHHNYLWEMVYYLIPGAQAMKCISRIFLVLALPGSFVLALETQRIGGWIGRLVQGKRKVVAGTFLVIFLGMVWFEQVGGLPFAGYSKERDRQRIEVLAQKIPKGTEYFFVDLGPNCKDRVSDTHQVDAMLVSILTGIPTLNGYDSSPPPGWNMDLNSKKYLRHVQQWLAFNHLDSSGYRLEINDED